MIHKNPKLFEYDEENGIVDVFVRKDPQCPYPFTNGEWWHQGFYLDEFIIYLNDFFKRNNIQFKNKKENKKEGEKNRSR